MFQGRPVLSAHAQIQKGFSVIIFYTERIWGPYQYSKRATIGPPAKRH